MAFRLRGLRRIARLLIRPWATLGVYQLKESRANRRRRSRAATLGRCAAILVLGAAATHLEFGARLAANLDQRDIELVR